MHPISSDNVSDMFPAVAWSLPGLSGWCKGLFGVTPRPYWLPSQFGMDDLPRFATSVSKLVFTNGLLDPWSSQSVTASLSDTLVAVNIADGSHHSAIGAPPNPVPTDGDSDSVKAARARVETLLRQWIL